MQRRNTGKPARRRAARGAAQDAFARGAGKAARGAALDAIVRSTLEARADARPASESLAAIASDVVACRLCPRLRRHCEMVARTKRRAFRTEEYWGKPVPGFGDPEARLWILGLAPAAHGANRTGRMFTGDSSGDWLFAALHETDFAHLASSASRHDGQRLTAAYISAVVRCAPPDNKPAPREIDACSDFSIRELAALRHVQVLLCLGSIAFAAALRLLQGAGYEVPRPRPRFAHGAEYVLRSQATTTAASSPSCPLPPRPLLVLASYHPSRQNTQTGRLTRPMWQAIFRRIRACLGSMR